MGVSSGVLAEFIVPLIHVWRLRELLSDFESILMLSVEVSGNVVLPVFRACMNWFNRFSRERENEVTDDSLSSGIEVNELLITSV